MSPKKLILGGLVLAGVLAGAVAVAQSHEHGHGHGGADGAKLALDDGKKWQTDANLRQGMTQLRALVTSALEPIHAGTYTPEQYTALARGVEKQASWIVSNCKLSPEVDAQFHLLLAEFYGGASAMKSDGDRKAGVVKVVRALDAYGEYFDQPGWTKLAH